MEENLCMVCRSCVFIPCHNGWTVPCRVWELTFAGADVVEVQLVALLGSLQGALGGKEVAGGLVGLVVSAANLQERKQSSVCNAVTLQGQTSPHTCASDQKSPLVWKWDFPDFLKQTELKARNSFFFSTLCFAWCHRHQIALIEKLRPPVAPLLCLQANQITVDLTLKFFFLLAQRTKALHAETRRAAQLQLLLQMPVTLHSGQEHSGWF